MMASENTDTNAGNGEETGPSSETNEHDYAHAADGNFAPTEASSFSGTPAVDSGVTARGRFTTPAEHGQSTPGQSTASLPVELPEPAVGAEVDCPGGHDVDASQTEEDPQKAAASGLAVAASPAMGRGGRRRPKRPEDKHCSGCKSEFERQGRSFNRRAVFTFTTPETVQWVFPDTVVTDKSFLCETCAQVVRSKCKRKQTGKRPLWLKPPVTKQVCVIIDRDMSVLQLRRFSYISPSLSLHCTYYRSMTIVSKTCDIMYENTWHKVKEEEYHL